MEKVVQVHDQQQAVNPAANSAPVKPPTPSAKMMNPFPKANNQMNTKMIVIALVVVLAGVATGWALSGTGRASNGSTAMTSKDMMTDQSNSDSGAGEASGEAAAEGTLEEGGINGEGTHHLVRPGGDTQTVYLTSTTLNLQDFAGKKVQIWGETLAGKSAGWLMDVTKVKVIQ